MRSDGLRIEGPTALHVPRVSATDDPGEVGVVDVVMLCVKPALDAALGDALALGAGLPLATLLGGAPRPLPACNSCGLGLMSPPAAADEAERLLEGGFKALKLRLGYASLAEDLAATRAVRQRLPDDVALMVDYNQALSVSEALLRGRALQSEGVAWLEEPTRHDDLRGNAEIARALELPLQIGENFNGPQGLAQALDAQACDLVMPDVARIGGVTGWMQAAGVAAARGTPMSSHLMPELSAHLLAATPTGHWLEYVDWADVLLQQPLRIENGCALVPDRPGTGMVWDERAVAHHPLARQRRMSTAERKSCQSGTSAVISAAPLAAAASSVRARAEVASAPSSSSTLFRLCAWRRSAATSPSRQAA